MGIRPGMPMSEALALGTFLVDQHDPEEDLEVLCGLAEAAQQFSPIVGLETLDSKLWAGRGLHQPQGLLLDVTRLEHLFGGSLALAQQVRQWLAREGLVASVAIAGSVGAAWALANYADRSAAAHALLLQNSAAPSDEPAWRQIENLIQIDGAVLPLPVESLRLDVETVRTLHRLGVDRVESLVALPRSGLASRLGVGLLQRMDQAVQHAAEPIRSLHAGDDYRVDFDLEYPTDRRETLEEILRRALEQLCQRLSRGQQGAIRLLCRLDAVQSPSLVWTLNLFRATADPNHLIPLMLSQLDRQWDRPLQIHRVVVQAVLVAPLAWQQPSLFQVEEVVHRADVARLIDSLSCRLGRRGVVAPVLHRDPQPERHCSWRSLTGWRTDGRPQSTSKKIRPPKNSPSRLAKPFLQDAEPLPGDPLRRPLLLIHPPEKLGMILDPTTAPPPEVGGRLDKASFSWQGHRHRILQAWGPERIESGWWRGPSHRRDYYRVATDRNAWLWIFQCLNSHQWYLHGEFD
jgi:protein ImuB